MKGQDGDVYGMEKDLIRILTHRTHCQKPAVRGQYFLHHGLDHPARSAHAETLPGGNLFDRLPEGPQGIGIDFSRIAPTLDIKLPI